MFYSCSLTLFCFFFFFSSRRRHTRFDCDWSSDVCSSDLVWAAPIRTFLGLRIGVARTVNLNRRLTDEEWERLVVQLREVFNRSEERRVGEEGRSRWSPDH